MSGSAREAAPATTAGHAPVPTLARRTSARPLDAGVRQTMETRFGHDFGNVRVHADDAAARSASALDARAYAIDSDIVFGSGEYEPRTPRGQRLLAHELAHVVQRGQGGSSEGAEERADRAAATVTEGGRVGPAQLGAARPGVHRQPKGGGDKKDDADADAPAPEIKPFTVPISLLGLLLPKLQMPGLLGPAVQKPIIPLPQLTLGSGSGAAGGGGQAAPGGGATLNVGQVAGLPPAGTPAGPLAPLAKPASPAPTLPASPTASASPDLPSRIGITDVWKFSLGLRFGLPKAKEFVKGTPPQYRVDKSKPPGLQESPTAVSDYQFELLDIATTGKVPQGFDAIDKGDLIKASFGIVANYIAPDLVASLAKKVMGKPGADFKLDLTIDGSFKGGGITFEMPLGKPKKAYKAPAEASP